MSQVNPTCPTDCTSVLPAVTYNECAQSIRRGEVERLYIASNYAASFADVSDLSEWVTRLALASGNIDSIRRLRGQGDLPIPSRDETIISLGQKIPSPADFVLNFDIEDISLLNYEFMRTLQCGTEVKIWFETNDLLFGGDDGINVTITSDIEIVRGQKGINMLKFACKWTELHSPEVVENPFQ